MLFKRLFLIILLFLGITSIYTLVEKSCWNPNSNLLSAKTLLYSFKNTGLLDGTKQRTELYLPEWKTLLEDTLKQAITFPLTKGGAYTIVSCIYHVPVQPFLFHDAEKNTLNWLINAQNDTLFYQDKLTIEIYSNQNLVAERTFNAFDLQETLAQEWRTYYALLNADCVAYHEDYQQFVFQLAYGLPGSVQDRVFGFITINPKAEPVLKGTSGICDGKISIRPEYLLTCQELIRFKDHKRIVLHNDINEVAAVKFITDSTFAFILAPQNPQSVPFNAYLFSTNLDTLFTFVYEGYTFDGQYHIAFTNDEKQNLSAFLDTEYGELIVFPHQDLAAPALYHLKDLDINAEKYKNLTNISILFQNHKYTFYRSSNGKIVSSEFVKT